MKLHALQEKCCFTSEMLLNHTFWGHSNFVGSSTPGEMSPFEHCKSVLKSLMSLHWEKFISFSTLGHLIITHGNCHEQFVCSPQIDMLKP